MTVIIGSFRLGGAGRRPVGKQRGELHQLPDKRLLSHPKANCAVKSSSSGRGEGEKGAVKYFSDPSFAGHGRREKAGCYCSQDVVGAVISMDDFLSQTCLCSTHCRAIQGTGTASTDTLHLGTAWESQKRVTVERAQQGLQAARAPIAPCCSRRVNLGKEST